MNFQIRLGLLLLAIRLQPGFLVPFVHLSNSFDTKLGGLSPFAKNGELSRLFSPGGDNGDLSDIQSFLSKITQPFERTTKSISQMLDDANTAFNSASTISVSDAAQQKADSEQLQTVVGLQSNLYAKYFATMHTFTSNMV